MKLRCRPGDLAIVIGEEPGCEMNLGRFVRVRGPLRPDPNRGPSWLIRPVDREPWAVMQPGGRREEFVVDWADHVEHADRWLLPMGESALLDMEVTDLIVRRV